MNGKLWTKKENRILEKHYPFKSQKEIEILLPHRTWFAIKLQANKSLKLTRIIDFHEPVFPILKETDKAYLAGLLDGEGSIMIAIQPATKTKSPNHYLRVTIANTDKRLMKHLKTLFNGSVYISCHARNGNYRDCFSWNLVARRAGVFLKTVFPYLIIKKKQAKLAIEYQKTRSYVFRDVSKKTLALRDNYRRKIQQLNKPYLKKFTA